MTISIINLEEETDCAECGSWTYPEDRLCWRCDYIARNPNGFHVNVYEVDRVYGGPEEGGWWFTTGEPKLSVHVVCLEDAEIRRDQLAAIWQSTGDSNSVVYSGGDYNICIEDHPAAPFPEVYPHYE